MADEKPVVHTVVSYWVPAQGIEVVIRDTRTARSFSGNLLRDRAQELKKVLDKALQEFPDLRPQVRIARKVLKKLGNM